jgi:uncharacterized protein YfaP (DUF2135 family)
MTDPVSGRDGPVVSTSVVQERGQWTVMLDVVFPDGAVRHRLQTYHTKARAELAARIMRATAERDHRPEWGMP